MSFCLRDAMSKQVRVNLPLVNFLLYAKTPKQFKAVLTTLTEEQVKVLCEIAVNILYGVISISNSHKQHLKKHAKKLEFLGDSSNSLKKKKLFLERHPAILQAVLTAAKPVLKSLLQ